MYGQMTAGSWIYIGTQGILQGTYETFAAVARRNASAARCAGTLTLTGGLRRDGRRPAAGRHDERRRAPLRRRRPRGDRSGACDQRYLDEVADDLDDAIGARRRRRTQRPRAQRRAGRQRRDVLPELLRRGVEVDIVTDQTSAHDPLTATSRRDDLERGLARLREQQTRRSSPTARAGRWPPTSRRWSASRTPAPRSSTTATPSAARPSSAATTGRSPIPGFVPAYIRPLFCEGKGPFRWAALSGDPADIARDRPGGARAVPRQRAPAPLDHGRAGARRLPGPARADLLARLRRARPAGLRFNELVADGEISAPIVIGRDHLDCGLGRLALPRDRGDGSTAPTRSPTGRCSTRW